LDRRLERLGVGFARYADDTLIWSDNYADIGRATNVLEDAAREMGVDFNFLKSKGVSLLSPEGMPTEITSQNSLDYLGYTISQTNLSIRQKSVIRIKRRIAYLIYSNLLQEPKRGHFPANRVLGPIDRDYPVLIYQLRRYLYGGLSEAKLRRYLSRQVPQMRYRGLMSFYPVVDDEELLASLDGWMLSCVMRALKLRSQMFSVYFPGKPESPFWGPICLNCTAPSGIARPKLHLQSKNRAIPCRPSLAQVIDVVPRQFLRHLSLLLFLSLGLCSTPPADQFADSGNNAILRNIAANRVRVKCPSASIIQ
jgi:hypothetical protein